MIWLGIVQDKEPAAGLARLLTEGEGISRWFAPETRVTPGVGGTVLLSRGAGAALRVDGKFGTGDHDYVGGRGRGQNGLAAGPFAVGNGCLL